MQQVQSNRALSMNLDKSLKNLTETECFFLLNNERYLNGYKPTLGETTPLAANHPACDIEQPVGENYSVGEYYSQLTNELYSWIYNSNEVHYIQRINGDGECQVVYFGCLKLSASPRHKITQFRAYLQLDKLCANRHGKTLIWTNGEAAIGSIDVEASIATNSFTTPFFQRCADPCELIQLCVPDPCGCLYGEFMPLEESERGKNNNLVDVGIQLSYRHVYYDGRASIWADPSTLFYQDTKGCFENTDGFPRCLKTRLPVGNPLVEKIEVAFIKNGAWYRADVVEKYKKYNSSQQFWYERELAELLNYSDDDCSFDYIFCNDKQCELIDPTESIRVFNPMPIQPQGILPIGVGEDRTSLGYYNFRQGSCPIDKTEVEKVNIDVVCPENNCNPEYATIKVRAIIHNLIIGRNQFIYRLGGESSNSPDDPSDAAYFGGLMGVLDGGFEIGYDQRFVDKTRNFIVYIEGTDYWAEMKQWKAHAFFQNLEEWGTIGNMNTAETRNRWRRAARNGEFFYQEAEIKVLKGTRGFLRLASHKATGNEQDTSTFVRGLQNLHVYKGDFTGSDGLTSGVEEIYFDTCNGDLDLTESAFVVDDNAADSALATKSSAYNGYIKDESDRPVEGAVVEIEGKESVTDHNGFYHLYLSPGTNDPVSMNIKVEQDCFNFTTVKTESIQGAAGQNTQLDSTIDNEAYNEGFYANVVMSVLDCQGHPVGGVRVSLSGTKYDVTDAAGVARFRIRNYEDRNRVVRAVVMNNNGCFATDCIGTCNPCMPTATSNTIPCYLSKPTITLTTSVINRTYSLITKNGLKSGGRYPFAFVVKGDCGRQSAANEIRYIDIPRTQQKNQEGFCSFSYDATGITLPSWGKCLDIVRGVNVNPFELQWVVDKITRSDGKVKLTIQSLNDYNAKYFFKTNTVYQWVKGDRVEFIKNGDGSIFSIAAHGLLNYLTISPFFDEDEGGEEDAPADYFNQLLIDDDGKLDGLKEGAVIEIQRIKECTTLPEYHSICVSIPIVDGKLLYETGVFTTFDTYMVRRTIGKLPPQRFEHHSPSDFWGDRLSDIGRAYFVNKYENERRFGRNITLSAPNELNHFGSVVKTIDPDGHGDIVAMSILDNKIGLCISEHDNSLFEVSDDLLRVNQDGVVRASTPDQLISDSQPKISGAYGCQYDHIGSILFGDGYATWMDVNKHTFVKHDYQTAVPADEGKFQSYSRRRCQELETFNRSAADPLDHLRFCTGLNYHTGAIHLTIKSLRHSGIYNETKPYLHLNDTILYHPIAEDCLGFSSFTPEGYGRVNLFDGNGCAIITFLNGIPYIHPVNPDRWNEFYGEAVDRVVGISLNKFPSKEKKGVSIEVEDDKMWYVADVSTENPTFRSEIPAKKWTRDMNKWNSAFLRNINSIGGLYSGKTMFGKYLAVTFVRDNTEALRYGTIDNEKRVQFDLLDEIHFKFMIAEQSGFTENV